MTDWPDIAHASIPDQPPPVACVVCGAPSEWEWWEPPPWSNGLLGTWCRPQEACHACTRVLAAREERERAERALRASGVPSRYWGYTFERTLKQESGEHWTEFQARLRRQHLPTVGLTPANTVVARELYKWRPERGTSVYLEGKVGTGKSLFSACLTARLLSIPLELRQVEQEQLEALARRSSDGTEDMTSSVDGITMDRRTAARHLANVRRHEGVRRVLPWVRSGGYQVLWRSEAELERELMQFKQTRWHNSEATDPMTRAKKVGVLVLDDVGSVDKESWRPEFEALVAYRYNRGLPMVMTGNLPWLSVQEHYGSERAADRLREMVPRPMVLDLCSWRAA